MQAQSSFFSHADSSQNGSDSFSVGDEIPLTFNVYDNQRSAEQSSVTYTGEQNSETYTVDEDTEESIADKAAYTYPIKEKFRDFDLEQRQREDPSVRVLFEALASTMDQVIDAAIVLGYGENNEVYSAVKLHERYHG